MEVKLNMKIKKGLGFALGVGALFGVASVAVPVHAEGICADSTIETTCTAGTIDELIAGISNANVEGINLSNTINIAASAALDITNKTIVSGSYDAFVVTGEDVVFDISGNGEIRSGRYVVDVENGSTVNLTGGTLRTTGTGGFYGVYLFGGATLNMTGGVIDTTSGSGAAVGGNNTAGDMNFVMSGGTLKSKYQTVFMPSQVDLKISGGTLEGGIYAKMGQIDISGGEINGIADANSLDRLEDYYGLGDGYAWLGDAIAVQGGQYASANETYGNSLNIKISGGKISATNGSALLVWNAGKLEQSMKVEITGGEFSSAEGVESVRIIEDISTVVTPKAGFGVVDNAIDTTISGGVFSAEPEHSYVVEDKDIFQTDEGYVVDGKINLPTDGSMAITLFKGESFDVGFELDKRGEHAWLISDDSGLYTFDGMTITAGDNFGQAKYKVNYGGLIYNQEPEEYDIKVIEVPEFEVVTDEKLGLSDEVVAAIAGKVKDILEGKVYVAEDGSISWVSEDGKVWADPGHVKEAIMNGETLRVEMWSEEILMDELDEEGLAQLNEILEDGDTVVSMHDIELVIVNAEGYEVGGVDVLDEPVVLTFAVPEEMREAPEGYTRKFYAIRHHYDRISGTQIDRLEAEFDGENAMIQNDKFSGFVLVYQDEENVVTPGTGRFTKEAEDFAKPNSKVGVWVLACGMMMLGYGLVSLGKQYQEALRKR